MFMLILIHYILIFNTSSSPFSEGRNSLARDKPKTYNSLIVTPDPLTIRRLVNNRTTINPITQPPLAGGQMSIHGSGQQPPEPDPGAFPLGPEDEEGKDAEGAEGKTTKTITHVHVNPKPGPPRFDEAMLPHLTGLTGWGCLPSVA